MWVPYYPQSSTKKGLRQGYCIFIEFMEIVQVLNFETLEVELFSSWLLGGRLMTISAYLLKHKKSQKKTTTQTNTKCIQITQPSLVKLVTITFCAFFRIGERLLPQYVSTHFPIIDYIALVNSFWESSISWDPAPAPPALGESRNKKWEKALFSWGPSPLGRRVEIRIFFGESSISWGPARASSFPWESGGPEAGLAPLAINSELSSVEPTNGKIRPPRFPSLDY